MTDHPDRWGQLVAVNGVRVGAMRHPARKSIVLTHQLGSVLDALAYFRSEAHADLFMSWLRDVGPLVSRARQLREIPGLYVVPDPASPTGFWLNQSTQPGVPPAPFAVPALYTGHPELTALQLPEEGHEHDDHEE